MTSYSHAQLYQEEWLANMRSDPEDSSDTDQDQDHNNDRGLMNYRAVTLREIKAVCRALFTCYDSLLSFRDMDNLFNRSHLAHNKARFRPRLYTLQYHTRFLTKYIKSPLFFISPAWEFLFFTKYIPILHKCVRLIDDIWISAPSEWVEPLRSEDCRHVTGDSYSELIAATASLYLKLEDVFFSLRDVIKRLKSSNDVNIPSSEFHRIAHQHIEETKILRALSDTDQAIGHLDQVLTRAPITMVQNSLIVRSAAIDNYLRTFRRMSKGIPGRPLPDRWMTTGEVEADLENPESMVVVPSPMFIQLAKLALPIFKLNKLFLDKLSKPTARQVPYMVLSGMEHNLLQKLLTAMMRFTHSEADNMTYLFREAEDIHSKAIRRHHRIMFRKAKYCCDLLRRFIAASVPANAHGDASRPATSQVELSNWLQTWLDQYTVVHTRFGEFCTYFH